MNIPVTITENALEEIKKISQIKGISPLLGLRLGIKGAGCSGTSYLLGFDEKNNNDVEFEVNGIRIFIEKKHFLYLTGVKIDFIDNNNQRGFTFVNP